MKAIDLANYIINRSIDNQTYIGNLQLQKILYFVNLLYLGKNKKFLVEDNFEAWVHGPVVPEVYREFSLYGGNKIYSKVNENKEILFTDVFNKLISEGNLNKINENIDYLCIMNPYKLIEYSQARSSAWYYTLYVNKFKNGKIRINNGLILIEAGVK